MQAQGNILQRISYAYMTNQSMRVTSWLGMPVAALLLFVLGGGMPPWAWRLLARALPDISSLLALRGSAVLLALTGLVLLALTILFAWGLLFWLAWRMVVHGYQERQARRVFAEEMEEARYMLEEDEQLAHAAAFTRSTVSRFPSFLARDEMDDDEYQDENGYAGESYEPGEEIEDSNEDGVYYDEDEDNLPAEYQEDRQDTVEQSRELENMSVLSSGIGVRRPYAQRRAEAEELTQSLRPVHLVSAASDELNGSLGKLERLPSGRSGWLMSFALPDPVQTSSPPQRDLYGDQDEPLAPLPAFVTRPAVEQSAMQLIVSTGLDAGLKRRHKPNEDSLLALQNTRILRGCACPVGLFVIADGMGGHENGQEASRMVIQSLSKTVVPAIIYGPTDDNYAELLAEGVHHANLDVYQRNRQEKADMGTTIAAALVVNTTAYVANVGDSRVYLYRSTSGLSQVTRDHSTVARLVEEGVIEPDEIYTHPRRNEIYRSLGRHASEEIDKFILALQPEDILLLCSDGLWEMVRDPALRDLIEAHRSDPNELSSALVQAALDGGGKDNISVIVVHIQPFSRAGEQDAWAG